MINRSSVPRIDEAGDFKRETKQHDSCQTEKEQAETKSDTVSCLPTHIPEGVQRIMYDYLDHDFTIPSFYSAQHEITIFNKNIKTITSETALIIAKLILNNGSRDEIKDRIEKNPKVLLSPVQVEDRCQRKIIGTLYQLALGAGNLGDNWQDFNLKIFEIDSLANLLEKFLLNYYGKEEVANQKKGQFPYYLEGVEFKNVSSSLSKLLDVIREPHEHKEMRLLVNECKPQLVDFIKQMLPDPKYPARNGLHFGEHLRALFNTMIVCLSFEDADIKKLLCRNLIEYIKFYLTTFDADLFNDCAKGKFITITQYPPLNTIEDCLNFISNCHNVVDKDNFEKYINLPGEFITFVSNLISRRLDSSKPAEAKPQNTCCLVM